MPSITSHKGGRTKVLPARVSPRELSNIKELAGALSIADWVALQTHNPLVVGGTVRVIIRPISGGDGIETNARVLSKDTTIRLHTDAGQEIIIQPVDLSAFVKKYVDPQ